MKLYTNREMHVEIDGKKFNKKKERSHRIMVEYNKKS